MNGSTISKGDRIELIRCADDHTKLPAHIRGTVALVDAMGTVHVDWDNGASLGLIPGVDDFVIVRS